MSESHPVTPAPAVASEQPAAHPAAATAAVSSASAATGVSAPAAAPSPSTPALVEVSIDQFFATELKVGTVKLAERVPKSDKLVRLLVDLGEETLRQLVAGIGKAYTPEELMGRQVVVVANLKPAKLMGVESRGMVLAATDADGKPILVRPHADGAPNGTRVK
ncbi:MAG: methionine--tRNA ligase subunit beta [Thermoanaerobaculia bacterium]